MVSGQIENRGVSDPNTIKAMRTVPRHLFVPSEFREKAYDDSPLPIGFGQTISQPFIVGYMTSVLDLTEQSRVLEIGTGSGYQAAVLSQIADSVFTVEIVPGLAERARNILERLKYLNVQCRLGDGYNGWPEKGPFDAIIVTAAAEKVPPALAEQLKDGGKMIIPLGGQYEIQYLVLITRKNGNYVHENLIPVRFVPFVTD